MQIRITSLAMILLICPLAAAQTTRPAFDASQVINVYAKPPATAPSAQAEELRTERFYRVSEPAIYVWPAPADKANGTAIIACPGGSYDHITMEAEGHAIARWLNPMGITVFGLKYRTRPPSTDVAADALLDGQRAVRLVRSRAKEFNINPDRIGMLGYSAGANLVLNLASHFDRGMAHGTDAVDLVSCRPDFVVMLSTWPNQQTIDKFPLSPDSPPTFIAIAKDDRTAPPPFTAQIKARLDEAKVPTELYEAERGGHGAFHLEGAGVDTGWKQPFLDWMKKNKWL